MKLRIVSPLLILLLLMLAACSSGGGGGGGTTPKDTVTVDGFSITPTTLAFTANVGGTTPEPQYITLQAPAPGANMPFIDWDGVVVIDVLTEIVDDRTLKLRVIPADPASFSEGVYNGHVDIAAEVAEFRVNVKYTINPPPPGDPDVKYVTPQAVAAGFSGDIVISGSGFSRFDATSLPTVTFGTTAATNIRVVSDRELRVTHPSLTVGTYTVNVSGKGIEFPSTASLTVLAPVSYVSHFSSYGGFLNQPVAYDAARQTVYSAQQTPTVAIVRHRFVSDTWQQDQLDVAGLNEFDVTADGSTMVIAAGTKVYVVDLTQEALSIMATHDVPLSTSFNRVVCTSDGKALLVGGAPFGDHYVFDPADGSLISLDTVTGENLFTYLPLLWRSPDGSQVVISDNDGVSPAQTHVYYPGTQKLTDPANPVVVLNYAEPRDVAISRDVQTIIFDGSEIRDGNWTVLASLPLQADVVVLSSDGNTAYGYYGADKTIRAYDISDTANIHLVSSGSPSADLGSGVRITISPDDATLFLTGSNGLAVVPISGLTPAP